MRMIDVAWYTWLFCIHYGHELFCTDPTFPACACSHSSRGIQIELDWVLTNNIKELSCNKCIWHQYTQWSCTYYILMSYEIQYAIINISNILKYVSKPFICIFHIYICYYNGNNSSKYFIWMIHL